MDETGALIAGGTILFTIVMIVVTLAATILPLVLVFRWLAKTRAGHDQLLATGVPAQGRILQMGPTGLTVNNAPQLALVLEVHPPAQAGYRGAAPPFIANVQALVPVYAMGRVQPGAFVPLRFDATNPSRVAIDFRAMGYV